MKLIAATLGLVAMGIPASATIISSGDSANFLYKYEMDVGPETQDLDGAGSVTDWFATEASGLIIPTVSGGIARSNQGTSPPEVLFRTDFGGSIVRENLVGGSYTVEISARLLGPLDGGDVGQLAIAIDPGGTGSEFRFNIDSNRVNLDGNGNSEIATASNTDGFHAFRVAYDAVDDAYSAWRDGVLLYDAVTGTNGHFINEALWIGDFSGSLSGEWEIDYIRLDDEAIAPLSAIPEPATAVLLVAGLGGLLLRRRS